MSEIGLCTLGAAFTCLETKACLSSQLCLQLVDFLKEARVYTSCIITGMLHWPRHYLPHSALHLLLELLPTNLDTERHLDLVIPAYRETSEARWREARHPRREPADVGTKSVHVSVIRWLGGIQDTLRLAVCFKCSSYMELLTRLRSCSPAPLLYSPH